MQIDTDSNIPISLADRLRSRIALSKHADTLNVYLSTLSADIQAAAKQPLDSVPNLYVYAYSLSKGYLRNKDQRLQTRIEELYEFFHTCVYSCFDHDATKTLALLKKDTGLEQLLAEDYQSYSKIGKCAKYIFSVLLLWIKARDGSTDSEDAAFGRIADLVCSAALSEELFLRTQALKLVSKLLETDLAKVSAFIKRTEEYVNKILESWFIKAKELPRMLDLLLRTLHHFPETSRTKVIERLLEVSEGRSTHECRTKIFIIVESVFAKSYFSKKFTEGTIRHLNKIEENIVELFNEKKVAFAFSRARLQVILNYYAVD